MSSPCRPRVAARTRSPSRPAGSKRPPPGPGSTRRRFGGPVGTGPGTARRGRTRPDRSRQPGRGDRRSARGRGRYVARRRRGGPELDRLDAGRPAADGVGRRRGAHLDRERLARDLPLRSVAARSRNGRASRPTAARRDERRGRARGAARARLAARGGGTRAGRRYLEPDGGRVSARGHGPRAVSRTRGVASRADRARLGRRPARLTASSIAGPTRSPNG